MAARRAYEQIAGSLRASILSGEVTAGALMPSESTLAAEHGVSRGTVRAALAVLASEDLIYVVPGRGRRVAGGRAVRTGPAAWEVVAGALREEVRALVTGPMSSEADLMVRFGVSRNTARRAYRQLADEGLVVIRHGAGAFPARR